MKILGIYGKNEKECETLNWKDKVQNILHVQTLHLWRQRQLTVKGRAVVINTLLMSKLWYTLSVISMPKWQEILYQKHVHISFGIMVHI